MLKIGRRVVCRFKNSTKVQAACRKRRLKGTLPFLSLFTLSGMGGGVKTYLSVLAAYGYTSSSGIGVCLP